MTCRIGILACLLCRCCLSSVAALADEPDLSGELPRVPPRSPHEALSAFHVAAGFRVELAAAEPQVVDPVAVAFDADGRMYVVEMRDYSEQAEERLGRIRRLTDSDDDGVYESSSLFAESLSWPTAIACSQAGVYVAAAPELIFLRDLNGDGVADERRVVFQGFGRDNVQGLVNSLQWSLDHWLHGATSSTGAQLYSLIDPQQPVLELRGRDFAFDPRSGRLVPTTGGGQHGMSFNRWGERFVCANSDHLQQIVIEDRYLSRNPWMVPPAARVSIAADGPQAVVYRSSPVEAWREVRTRLRVAGIVPGPIEGGGTAAGYFTGATGVTIYRGSAWPSEYLDYALVCDVGSNLIHRKRLVDEGTRYRGVRVDERSEFLTSDDIWFRPVQLAGAPDGTIYILDMYREVIEHPASLPPIIKRHLDLTSGRDRGRIYRIVADGFPRLPAPQLSLMSTDELVATLAHPNGWHRETASRLLCERQVDSCTAAVRNLLANSPVAEGRLQALHLLSALGRLQRDDLLVALQDREPHVRRHAVELAERLAADDPLLQQALFQRVTDSALKVRYQLALTLGELPHSAARQRALAELARRAIPDRYALAAVQTALKQGATDLLDLLARDAEFRRERAGQEFLLSLASQVARQREGQNLPQLEGLIADLSATRAELFADLLLSWMVPHDGQLAEQLRSSATGPVIQRAVEQAMVLAVDSHTPLTERLSAIKLLALADWPQVAEQYRQLLAPSQPQPLQLRAVDSLAWQTTPAVAEQVVADWSQYSPALRPQLIGLLLTRAEWQSVLIKALENRRLNVQELSALQQQQLARMAGAARWSAIESSPLEPTDSELISVLDQYRQAWHEAANLESGRQVFRTVCATCHRLEDVGHEVGPNLLAMRSRGREAMLVNVLDPNREVNPQYLAYTAVTNDGRIFTGTIRTETATSIELVQADNVSHVLLRDELESLTSTQQSLMPTGLQKQVSAAALNDLFGYLESLTPQNP